MASTSVTPQISDPELEQDDPIVSHIVGPDYDKGLAKLKAIVEKPQAATPSP